MSQHDYIIDNQTASAFRTDLNNALAAVATINSGTTAPATTYANMLWYETDTNILWKRNEGNSAWISLGTVDEGASKFEPNQTLATQAEAEGGVENTHPMTALRVRQGVSVLVASLSTASGASVVASGLDLTTYRQLSFTFNFVSSSAGPFNIRLEGVQISPDASTAPSFIHGIGTADLANGAASFNLSASTGAAPVMALGATYAGDLNINTATTTLTFTPSAGNFDNGTIRIYGCR